MVDWGLAHAVTHRRLFPDAPKPLTRLSTARMAASYLPRNLVEREAARTAMGEWRKQGMKKRLQQGRYGGFAHPAETRGGHGDAELAPGLEGLETTPDVHCQSRRGAAFFGQRLDAEAAGLDQGKLGSHEEAVGAQQQDGGDQPA